MATDRLRSGSADPIRRSSAELFDNDYAIVIAGDRAIFHRATGRLLAAVRDSQLKRIAAGHQASDGRSSPSSAPIHVTRLGPDSSCQEYVRVVPPSSGYDAEPSN